MSIITDILDQAVALQPGEKLCLQCNSTKELKSLKVSLYRERKKYEEKAGNHALNIVITQEKIGDDIFKLYIFPSNLPSKLAQYGAVIITPTGEPVGLPTAPVDPAGVAYGNDDLIETESQRARRLMKEDGLSEEEINEILKEG